MRDSIPSRNPGILEHLKIGDKNFAPIDCLLMHVMGEIKGDSFEQGYFEYKGKSYVFHRQHGDDGTLYCIWEELEGYEFDTLLESDSLCEALDAPCLVEGASVRQVLSKLPLEDFSYL